MLYPRIARVGDVDKLVSDSQCVGYKEHMTQSYRTLFLSGVLSGETDSHNLLLALDTLSHDPIKVIITSSGGDLDAAFLFVDTMRMIESPVITIGRFCASAACLILASGSERYLFPHAKTMLHLATGQSGGDYKDFAIRQKLMTDYQDKIIDILIESGVNKSHDEILVDIDREFWLDPAEAISYGLADMILTPEIWKKFKEGE